MIDMSESMQRLTGLREKRASVEAELAPWKAVLAEIDGEEEEIRTALLEAMNESGIKTFCCNGLEARRATRTEMKIIDPDAVRASLATLGKLDGCERVSLDTAAVKKVAKEYDLAGIESITSDRLEIRDGAA